MSKDLVKIKSLGASKFCDRATDNEGHNLGGAWAHYVYDVGSVTKPP